MLATDEVVGAVVGLTALVVGTLDVVTAELVVGAALESVDDVASSPHPAIAMANATNMIIIRVRYKVASSQWRSP